MNPFKLAIQLWLIVGFMCVIPQITFCQQFSEAINLQDSDGLTVGRVKVNLFHKGEGGKLIPLSGNGGEFNVSKEANDFICRFENLTLTNDFDGGVLTFNLDNIKFKTTCDISITDKTKLLDLKDDGRSKVDINFNVKGTGKVSVSFPYEYEGNTSTIARFFTLNSSENAKKGRELSSKDISKLYNKIDKKDLSSLENFVARYDSNRKARKYVKSANRLITNLLKEEREIEKARLAEIKKNKANKAESEKLEKKTKREDEDEGSIHSIDKLPEDVEEIVNNLERAIEPNSNVINQLSISYGSQVKTFKTATNEQPIQILFSKLGEKEPNVLNGVSLPKYIQDTGIVLNESLLNANHIVGDFSAFTIRNAFGNQIHKDQFDLSNERSSSQAFMWIMILTALLAGGGYFVFANKRKKDKKQAANRKKIEEKLNQNKQQFSADQPPVTNVQATTNSDKPKIKAKIKIGQKTDALKTQPVSPQGSVPRTKSKSRIKISTKKKAGQAIPIEELTKYVHDIKAVHLNLKTMWADSAICDVFISSTFIEELDNFLAESSSEGIQNELQGAVPEVGGFMMGKYSETKEGLHVVFEKFVPFVPEYNDVFKIEIGTKTVVDELGDAQDKNPKMEVVGWFHTHPGHGLFLSTSDLSVQRHFAKNYQVAMEIDSLTEGLDMSIFTRKNTGRMNNANDRLSEGWFQWVDVENMNLK